MAHVEHSLFSSIRKRIKRLSLHRNNTDSDDGPEDQGSLHLPSPTPSPTDETADFSLTNISTDVDEQTKHEIANLIAEYGSSSATSWLEFSRYKIWRAPKDIPPSSFRPIQGYLRSDPYVFAWGNPLVSDPAALEDTCYAFWKWCKKHDLRLVWCCVDGEMEKVLGKNSRFGWVTLSCIVEDVLDPTAVVELAQSQGGGEAVKDFKKNLRRAQRAGVAVRENKWDAWLPEQKEAVEKGIASWKKAKAKNGLQLASTSFQPWVDAEHRRYWIAEHEGQIVGILILSRIHSDQYQIKNAVSFPAAPRGTSEYLIYHTMTVLHSESEQIGDSGERLGAFVWEQNDGTRSTESSPGHTITASSGDAVSPRSSVSHHVDSAPASVETNTADDHLHRVSVTFGITASETLTPVDNLKGWKISWLSSTYNKVVGGTGITKRGDFRSKFHTVHMPMYVCFPRKPGLGVDGVAKLIRCLRQ